MSRATPLLALVLAIVTTACGFAAKLRAFRDSGAHENANRCSSSSHTPHTGKACGRPAADTVTTQNVTVHAVDAEKGLILLKGAVPGPKGGLVVIRSAAKKSEEAGA